MITLPKSVNIMTYIINIALIWPELLNLDIKRSDIGTDMIIKTIHRCCAHYCISNMNEPTQIAKTLYDYMVILVHWPELQYDQQLNHHAIHLTAILKSPVFKSLYHTNRYVFNDTRINLVKSLELCFTRLDHWDTTYSEFIIPHIMPLMKDKTLANVCLEILGTLGAGALHSHQNKEKPGVNVIRQIFKGVLNFGNNCSEEDFPLQCVAAKGLILLSKENFPSVTPVLHWYSLIQPSFKKLVPPGLAYGIQQLGSHLK
ncbi:hypothetical protein BC941DRAFT_239879 [Chlamydoabsidia padenii]|nr:hypothetical protein BC941DRAFT_239879 [Chlamydoabsidia padenii]